ncbi:MAG: hypothetical protein PHR35_18075 [Kiritimatiellae bacterium]|nr:hypothetical protein [Kiritimatiellia bacterium]
MKRIAVCGCAAVLIWSSFSLQVAERVVLAVPAQHTLVNFAFEMAGMFPRDLDVVCYRQPAGEVPRLEIFDRAAWRWQELPMADWTEGAGLRDGASRLIVVGEPAVAQQLKSASWVTQSQNVDGRRLHEVANAVHKDLRLSRAQWERLSGIYGFKLEDRNVEARRYGRYGPPGSKRARPLPPSVAPGPRSVISAEEPAIIVHDMSDNQPAIETDQPAIEDPVSAGPVVAAPLETPAAQPETVAAPLPEDK